MCCSCTLVLLVLGLHLGPWNMTNKTSEATYEKLSLHEKGRCLIYLEAVDIKGRLDKFRSVYLHPLVDFVLAL